MKQTRNHLGVYLNDHLAGSETVINLLKHLQQTKAGEDVERFLVELRGDVIADRLTLEAVMDRAQVGKHLHRTATAWLVEKISRLKLRLDDPGHGGLYLLEALELVEVGIEGKRGLWRALAAAAKHAPELQGVNYDHLMQRAEDQHDRVESVRVEAAKAALVAV